MKRSLIAPIDLVQMCRIDDVPLPGALTRTMTMTMTTINPTEAPASSNDVMETKTPRRRIDPRLERARAIVDHNPVGDIALRTLANAAAMSVFHFLRRFKKAFGVSPLQYVLRKRVELAKALLAGTFLPIAEVAYRIGYENVSHFTQVFRRYAGMTPGAFRQSLDMVE